MICIAVFLIGWMAIGVLASEIGRRHINRMFPRQANRFGVFEAIMSLMGPLNLISMLAAVQPWRRP